MAQRPRKQESGDALDQIRTLSDRAAEAIAHNPIPVLAVLGAVLLSAAVYGGFAAWTGSREDAASAALAETRRAYQDAMGIQPGAPEPVEPANPEIAIRTRAEFVERFRAVAEEHESTSAAPLALLEAGDLLEDSGEHEAAVETWRAGLEQVEAGTPLRGLLLQRVGAAQEAQGRWLEAAEAYEAAGAIEAYPPRYLTLAEAARCYAEAGQPARAIALYERIRNEAPELSLPQHIDSLLSELRVAAMLPEPEPVP